MMISYLAIALMITNVFGNISSDLQKANLTIPNLQEDFENVDVYSSCGASDLLKCTGEILEEMGKCVISNPEDILKCIQDALKGSDCYDCICDIIEQAGQTCGAGSTNLNFGLMMFVIFFVVAKLT